MKGRFHWLVLVLLAGLVACGGATPTLAPTRTPLPVAAPTGPGASATPASGPRVTVQGASGQTVVSVERQGNTLAVAFTRNGQPITMTGSAATKRTYTIGTETIAVINPGDGTFKLQTTSGQLRWKVKIDGDTIKVSDNEANDHAYVLERRDATRIKVTRDSQELGNVRGHPERGAVVVEDASGTRVFECQVDHTSAYLGVLLLTAIPDAERYAILAELYARDL